MLSLARRNENEENVIVINGVAEDVLWLYSLVSH